MIQPEPSYSPITVFDIRYHTDFSVHESNAQSISRLAQKYDQDRIDARGRRKL